jgi:hypothetical protein
VSLISHKSELTRKWKPQADPGGHHFFVLNVFTNNTLVFVSAMVGCGKDAARGDLTDSTGELKIDHGLDTMKQVDKDCLK